MFTFLLSYTKKDLHKKKCGIIFYISKENGTFIKCICVMKLYSIVYIYMYIIYETYKNILNCFYCF